jgi:hypothetical protein
MDQDPNAPFVGAQPGLRVLAGVSLPLRVGAVRRGRGASRLDLGPPPPSSLADRARTTDPSIPNPGSVAPPHRPRGARLTRTRRIIMRKRWLACDPAGASAAEHAAAERVLARLVARAFAADHSELFARADHTISGPSSTAQREMTVVEESTAGGGVA